MTLALRELYHKRPALLLIAVALLFTLPLFLYLTPTLDDGDFTFYRLALTEFSSQFWQGDLYPRWLFAANDGLGSPAFIFLSPGAYYPSVLLQWLKGVDPDGTTRFILSIMLARSLAAVLCFTWLRRHLLPQQAFFATLLFLTIPYAIHEIYARKELAGQWAYVCVFAMLNARTFGALTLSQAALILVHLPSFITFGWLPFLYALCMHRKEEWVKLFLRITLACAFACALTAFYWLPLLQNKEFINSAYYFTGPYTYENNFLVHPNEFYCLPYFLLAAAAFIYSKHSRNTFLTTQFCSIAIIAFMLLPVSLFVWQLLPPLHYLQFPYRFLNATLIAFAITCAYLLTTKLKPLVIAIWVGGICFQGYVVYSFSPHDTSGALQKITGHKLVTLSEYRTMWQKNYPATLEKILNGSFAAQDKVRIEEGMGVVQKLSSGYDTLKAGVHTQDRTRVIFNWLYFPGMRITDKTGGEEFEALPEETHGLLSAYIPAGDYVLEATFPSLAGEKTGRLISSGSLFLLLASIVLANSIRKRHEQKSTEPAIKA